MVLSIVLRILAVLGIVILCVLAFLLALILLVLILPICYSGSVEKKKDTELVAAGSVSAFLRAFRLRFGYEGAAEDKTEIEYYIFGIPMSRIQRRREKRQESKKSKASASGQKAAASISKASASGDKTDVSENRQQRKRPTVEPGQRREQQEKETGVSQTATSAAENVPAESGERKERTGEAHADAPEIVKARRPNLIVRISAKIVSFINGLRAKLRKLMDLMDTIGDWLDYLATERFNRFKRLVIRQVIAVLRHCLPRKIRGSIHYGMEDPALTGKILAVICAVYPVLPGKLKIDPDFEEQVVEVEVSFRGHIVPAVILYRGLRILLCRELRVLLRRVKRAGKSSAPRTGDAAVG
ncbi:MAG: DUF2953 domain-containing protein [Eubacterium sp.]|nr:DUF2953 domain-containing protein [Eubacterium sp.]